MKDEGLIPPHGGRLVNCFAAEAEALTDRATDLPRIVVRSADLTTLYRMADGTLSPLTGPMTQPVYEQVLAQRTLQHNGRALAWTIPLSLPVDRGQADALGPGATAALADETDRIVGAIDVESVFNWDKPEYLRCVYGTERTDHPGADMVLKADAQKTHLIGGTIQMVPPRPHPDFGHHVHGPAQVREMIGEKGWEAVVAFQTRNPLHRAHEYALVYGLEHLLRRHANAGAVLNPLVGETKEDDVSADIRMRTYERLINSGELGDGDADLELWEKIGARVNDRVLLLGLDMKMFYAGPAEAIMHAIYRQNLGFTHIIIGRKHADAPYHDGTAIWGDFDAQEIFDQLDGELKIQPLKVGFAAFYESLGRVDLMANHTDEKPVFISGKKVRETLQRGEMVDPRIMRPSTSQILSEEMRQP